MAIWDSNLVQAVCVSTIGPIARSVGDTDREVGYAVPLAIGYAGSVTGHTRQVYRKLC